MTNGLQLNTSTVIGGLGTYSYTTTAAGFYTLSFKSFLPYQPAGGPPVIANPTAASSDITFVADSSGSLNSTYFTFNSADDLQGFYVWFNINSAGTDPAVAGRIGIEVDGATDATAATLAGAARTAVAANATAAMYFNVGGATTHLILTDKQLGGATGAADGTAATGFTFTNTAGSFGTPAVSGLTVDLKLNSTVVARYGNPSPTQAILGGSTVISASSGDTLSIVLASLSAADSAPNAVKTIANLFQGIGG